MTVHRGAAPQQLEPGLVSDLDPGSGDLQGWIGHNIGLQPPLSMRQPWCGHGTDTRMGTTTDCPIGHSHGARGAVYH